MLKKSVVFLFVFTGVIAKAQTSNFQVWSDFNPRFHLAERMILVTDIGYRKDTDNKKNTVLVRGAVRFTMHELLAFDLGVANFNTWFTSGLNSAEFRTFEYAFVNWPNFAGFSFKHRIGLDQRWFRFPDLGTGEFVHRLRYRLGVQSPGIEILRYSPFYFTGNIEVLRDISNDKLNALIDHNRYMIGIGNRINDKLRAELQYQIIYGNSKALASLVRDIDMIRVRVFYKFY